MGQQQLLLIILVTILVGLATIIAINTMQEARANSNIEAVKIEMMEASNNAQGYYRKPENMGGGGQSFAGITLEHILLDSVTENASYSITSASEGSFTLTAVPASNTPVITAVVSPKSVEFQ